MGTELQDLNHLAVSIFQNVTALSPLLKNVVMHAKQFQKSIQGTSNLATAFIDSLNTLAQGALVAQGATKNIGDVLLDVIEVYKELENMRLDLMKLFISEIIIPLESRAEQEINAVKLSQKGYNHDNKIQTEIVEKAKHDLVKLRKKTQKRKSTSNPGKYDTREKEMVQTLEQSEVKLKEVRERGLRKALIEERKLYCFVTERMCVYGRGIAAYSSRISSLMNQKTSDWQVVINKPTELPPESEAIVKNPSSVNTSTLKKKSSKSKPATRSTSFNASSTKYHTIDGRVAKTALVKPQLSCPGDQTSIKQPLSDVDFTNGVEKNENSEVRKIREEADIRMSLSNYPVAQKVKQISADQRTRLRALYDHTGQDPSQLTFAKGDLLNPICEPTSGWQYGENTTTGKTGWFPAAYTESVLVAPVGANSTSTMPSHGGNHSRVSLTAPREGKMRRFSSPAQRAPFLPEPDYDGSFPANHNGSRTVNDENNGQVPPPEMKSTSQNHPKRKENIPNLEALTAEIKKLHLAESVFEEESAEVADTVENDVGSSHDAGSFHNTSSFSAMPPPPPPPPLPSSFNGNGVTVSHNG